MGEMRNANKIWSDILRGRDHWEGINIDGKIILNWILGKQSEMVWTGCRWLRIETSGGFL
jgi:hypothetical protein